MIHIATIHWQTDKWIDIQLNYLRKYIKEDFRVYAFLNDVDPIHEKKFYFASHENIMEHEIKLNLLFEIMQCSAKQENDLVLFLDGDAFPINYLDEYVNQKLERYPLLAVQRRENHLGELLPHPSFCITTIKFWKTINGNWEKAYIGKFLGRKIFEVGGYLDGTLKNKNISWYPLLRSNVRNIHPLWYGIYDGIIYHHGSGFRMPTSRIDKNNLHEFIKLYYFLIHKFPERIFSKLNPTKYLFKKENLQSEFIYNSIIKSSDFFKFLQGQEIRIQKGWR